MRVETLDFFDGIRDRSDPDNLKISIGQDLAEKIEGKFLIFSHQNTRAKPDRHSFPQRS